MLKLGKKSSVDLLSGDEGWVIFKFSVPIILSYLLQQIYTISDAAICGQTLGVDDIAGVNDVFPILFIFLQFAVGWHRRIFGHHVPSRRGAAIRPESADPLRRSSFSAVFCRSR